MVSIKKIHCYIVKANVKPRKTTTTARGKGNKADGSPKNANKNKGGYWTCATCEGRFSVIQGYSCDGCNKPVCSKCLAKFREAHAERHARDRMENYMLQCHSNDESESEDEGAFAEDLNDRLKEAREEVREEFDARSNGVEFHCKKCDEKHGNLLETYV